MIQRCEDPNHPAYANYGGRGIKVCSRWRSSFEAFLADMGHKPTRASIDRIDVDGNYEAENCRWASPKEQARNRRTNRRVVLDGTTLALSEACERLGLNYRAIKGRKSLSGLPFSVAP